MKSFFFLLILFIIVYSSNCKNIQKYPESDHHKNGIFFNHTPSKPQGFFRIARHVLFGRNGNWTDYNPTLEPETKQIVLPYESNKILVTFIGHATVLIQINGINILTDPVFAHRAGPFGIFGPKRGKPVGIKLENLPKIDIILISHNHYDHLDLKTLNTIGKRDYPKILVPLGNYNILNSEGIANISEMDWWDSEIIKNLEIHFVPAKHNSGRGLFDRDATLWGSFFVKTKDFSFFFAGDTAYSDHFKSIYNKLGKPNIALLPIGAYKPRYFTKDFHLDPKEAVQAQIDLGNPEAIAIHHRTFQLTAEDQDEPVKDLTKALSDKKEANTFYTPLEGEAIILKKQTMK